LRDLQQENKPSSVRVEQRWHKDMSQVCPEQLEKREKKMEIYTSNHKGGELPLIKIPKRVPQDAIEDLSTSRTALWRILKEDYNIEREEDDL
tara:strand:+ start:330 stop:605 length:276 start_codon:yes stop_codon:yes gene_type:complete